MKKIKPLFFLCTFLICTLFVSCADMGAYFFNWGKEDADSRARDLRVISGDNLPDVGSGDVFSFVLITDTHYGSPKYNQNEKQFLKWFESKLDSDDETLRPRFMVCMGDTSDSGRDWQYNDYLSMCGKAGEKAKAKLGTSKFMVYTILGNHDLYNDGYSEWKKRIFPYNSFYKFSVKDFSFYFLDTASGTLGSSQLNDFQNDIKKDSNYKIVFSHYPFFTGGVLLFTIQDTMERNLFISVLAQNGVKYLFDGHHHEGGETDFGKFIEFGLQSLGEYNKAALVTVNTATGNVSVSVEGY